LSDVIEPVAAGKKDVSGLMSQTCVILLGGDIAATERLKHQCKDALVLAADSGIRHADALGLEVDLWLGDFDSTTPALSRRFASVPRHTYPREKDKTDGELAIDEGIARGAQRFVLVGAFGGERTDHAMLHAFQSLVLVRRNFDVLMTSGREEAVPLVAGTYTFNLQPETIFSLVGFADMNGVTISGARWPLGDRHVPLGSSLTLSNIAEGQVIVTIASGEGLFMTGSSG
jgi:thiamine pyrophosphokinase